MRSLEILWANMTTVGRLTRVNSLVHRQIVTSSEGFVTIEAYKLFVGFWPMSLFMLP